MAGSLVCASGPADLRWGATGAKPLRISTARFSQETEMVTLTLTRGDAATSSVGRLVCLAEHTNTIQQKVL